VIKRLLVFLLFAIAFALALLCGHHNATAADNPDPRLDAVASAIAGHPVHVWCEGDYAEWHSAAIGWTTPPEFGNVVHIHPWACNGLHQILDGAEPNTTALPLMLAADSIHVLTHESVHQRGGQYADCYGWYGGDPNDASCEGRTDCEALALDRATALALGVPATAPQQALRYKTVRRKAHGRWRRVRVAYLVWVSTPNWALEQYTWYQRQYHNGLPPQYLGPCGKV